MQSAEVRPDGTFEFPDAPPHAVFEYMAAAEGWVSEAGEPGDSGIVRPSQRVTITPEARNFTVPMEASTTLRVVVRDTAERPIKGATVSTWPNLYGHGGTTVFQARRVDSLREILDPTLKRTSRGESDGVVVSEGVTGRDGTALLRNLPAVDLPIRVTAKGYKSVLLGENQVKGVGGFPTRPGEVREIAAYLARE